MRGPIDFIIVGFDGPKFDGRILHALRDALDRHIIGLVALSVVRKGPDGTISTVNVAESKDSYIMEFKERYGGFNETLVEESDIEEMADLLENDTAAGLLVIEHLWALPLKQAILTAGGVLVAEGRIHPEAQTMLTKMGV